MKRYLTACILFVILLGCATDAPSANSSDNGSQTAILPPSASIGLSGSLIFIELDQGDQFLSSLNLENGNVTRLFTAPANGWIAQMDVAPDHTQVMLAYAPAPPEGQIQFGYTNLFLSVLDQTAVPREAIARAQENEVLFNPVWSPDGRFVYYSHVTPDPENPALFTNRLERLELTTGQTSSVVDDAIWPRLSADGSLLAYIHIDPASQANSLYISQPNGQDARLLVDEERFQVVDVPMFAPDGQHLYFSAAEPATTAVQWWERLLGIQVATAHTIPSDWFRVPIAGGEPERLTDINAVNLYGDFSPDGQYIGFSSLGGLYVMRPDGSELQQVSDVSGTTALSWIP